MKHLAILGVLAVGCLAGPSSLLAARPAPAPAGGPQQPQAIAVPADVVAAHPNGQPGGLTGVVDVSPAVRPETTANASERVTCWRVYFTADNSSWLGTEKEWINPSWCGNGSVTRSIDPSWHGQSCSFFIGCRGESGIGTWYGCANGCDSIGQQIDGHFSVYYGVTVNVDLTVLYQLYGNGQYWSYTYHN